MMMTAILWKTGPFLEMWRPCCWAPLAPPSWCSALAPPLSDHPAKSSVRVSVVDSNTDPVDPWLIGLLNPDPYYLSKFQRNFRRKFNIQEFFIYLFYFNTGTGISHYRTVPAYMTAYCSLINGHKNVQEYESADPDLAPKIFTDPQHWYKLIQPDSFCRIWVRNTRNGWRNSKILEKWLLSRAFFVKARIDFLAGGFKMKSTLLPEFWSPKRVSKSTQFWGWTKFKIWSVKNSYSTSNVLSRPIAGSGILQHWKKYFVRVNILII